MDEDGRPYSHEWVTVSKQVTGGPCELVYAAINVGANNNYAFFYHGSSTNGVPIVKLFGATRSLHPFKPRAPVYCPAGFYVDLSSNVDGVFIQWREIPG